MHGEDFVFHLHQKSIRDLDSGIYRGHNVPKSSRGGILVENPLTIKTREKLKNIRGILTQKELALRVGCSTKTISRWENRQTRLPLHLDLALEKLLSDISPIPSTQEPDFTFIDLFAGIGGIRIGFESIGGRCVFTSEWDDYAKKTYLANFPDSHDIAGDITKIEASEIPDHDILLAGFPCQPFSIAGVSKKNALGVPHGFECNTQGTLFFDVARIIKEKRPKAFLLENVKNLVSHDKGNTFRVITETLEKELNYKVTWRVIDGQNFVPQHRERILIIGFRENPLFSWEGLPFPSEKPPVMKDILHREDGTEIDVDDGRYLEKTGKVKDKYILSDNLWSYLKSYAEKHRARGNGFGFGLVGPENIARTLSARYYKDGSEILVDRGPGNNPRRLTPRECARLMGFPDTFKIIVSDTRAYKQFGNSVVCPLIKHVALLMKPAIIEMKQEGNHYQKPLF